MPERKDLRRMLFLLMGVLPVLVCVAGCSLAVRRAPDTKPRIAVVAKMINVDFWQAVKQGTEAAAKEFNVDIRFTAPVHEVDIDGQIALMREAIDDRVDAIVLAASDYERLVPATEEAVAAGIPVVVIDSAVHTDKITSFIATDNRDAGKRLGRQLIRFTGEKADIAIMNSVEGAASVMEREEGFKEIMKLYPDIRIVDTLYCRSDIPLAEKMTRELLVAHPEMDAIAAMNSMSAIGVARGVSQLGLSGQVKVVAFDNAIEQIEFIEDGTICSLVVQKPFAMGYLGIQTALQVLDGKKVEHTIDTGSTVIDRDNLYTPENQKLLFPFVR